MNTINLMSLNVRGLRDKGKRLQIFEWLKSQPKGKESFVFLQETHSTEVDETVWQNEWGSTIVFDHGKSNSCGAAILFPLCINPDYEIITKSGIGRKLCIKLLINEDRSGNNFSEILLLNLYAPTQDKQSEQLKFISTLYDDLETHNGNIIIGGDLNMCFDPILDSGRSNLKPTSSSIKMNEIIDNFDYIDVWRSLNTHSKRYTWRRRKPLTQSRLDYWFIPFEMLQITESCKITPSIKTDHSLISLSITINGDDKRGPGLWKFNNNLLYNNDYVVKIKEILNADYGIENPHTLWEYKKMKIRETSIAVSKSISKNEKMQESRLKADIEKLSHEIAEKSDTTLLDRLQEKQVQLEAIFEKKVRGNILRAKIQTVEFGEKCSKMFLNLEKRNYKMKHITKLKQDDNTYTNSPKEIDILIQTFYKRLYTKSRNTDIFDPLFLTNLPQINLDHLQITESDITSDELLKALKLMKNGKTPGTDGLTMDFYKKIWEDIKTCLLSSINYSFISGHLSIEQRRAVLRLIPKKDKDISMLKNWRPISLLNSDYKLIAQCLAQRLQRVLPNIISTDQNGYIVGRFIGQNIRSIIDVIAQCNNKKLKAIIAFLDFEKAFDKLDWQYIDNCLLKFGFGEVFRRWISVLYSNISTCVINNGYTTPSFYPSCGIRQGCPLSALLFILAVETLTIYIRDNPNIKGILLGNKETKATQLADDTTLFLRDIRSLHFALNALYMFFISSGLKLNYSKTEILSIGHKCYINKAPFNLKWVKERVYALGTWFYEDINACIISNHEYRLNQFRETLKIWKMRKLTLLGKITVIKSLALAKTNYCTMVLPTPEWFVNAIQTEITSFLWDSKPPKIKLSTIIAPAHEGGLGFTHVESFFKAQKASWVKRLITGDDPSWHFLKQYLPQLNFADLLDCTITPGALSFTIPDFYRQVLFSWFEIKQHLCLQDNSILNHVLWYNDEIKVGGKSVFYKQWYDKGITRISDLCDENSRVLSYEDFIKRYELTTNFLTYHSLLHAIPKQMLLTCMDETENQLSLQKLLKRSNKDLYSIIIKSKTQPPTSRAKWVEKGFIFSDESWAKIFIKTRTLTFDTKLQELQFKILHRIYATNSLVSKFDKNVSELCTYCGRKDSLSHCFVSCEKLAPFWSDFNNWININLPGENNFLSSAENILFGMTKDPVYPIDYCILHAKYFIHKTRKRYENKKNINFQFLPFLTSLKKVLQIDLEIYTNKGQLEHYIDNLTDLERILIE